ncbi:hypothetical protein AMAG_20542 [Allomyces macrogynus ATCC 38327]|uniref:Uncharacterized protein n=1 Tax=Allomyces macrogynus (strain ATCC 38327) TaxID=578462 RepID=A0A0L0TBQ2_ALLM3|nr:hypothetical protein AMAG_20542 [Allomyces macrogynus ATCC 38327]|eukprot:KNE72125.1 hypothetical protein AMAG_20542 [Allomyces macrogynus ATCC 38327]
MISLVANLLMRCRLVSRPVSRWWSRSCTLMDVTRANGETPTTSMEGRDCISPACDARDPSLSAGSMEMLPAPASPSTRESCYYDTKCDRYACPSCETPCIIDHAEVVLDPQLDLPQSESPGAPHSQALGGLDAFKRVGIGSSPDA